MAQDGRKGPQVIGYGLAGVGASWGKDRRQACHLDKRHGCHLSRGFAECPRLVGKLVFGGMAAWREACRPTEASGSSAWPIYCKL